MKKLILIAVCCLGGALFQGCEASKMYDKAKPIYQGVKAGVKVSDINPKTKDRLKKLDDKAVTYDTVRTNIKKSVQ